MENFVVSARKYRPANFVSVVGQSHITSTLKNAIARNHLAHAYLFCGPRGVGKTTCARIFAKAINCLSTVEDEACNECESCRSFNEGRSFNIHELDAASNNSVDDIRSLTDQVRIPPQIGKYSVYIIDEVHMLSSAAFNAFLKTLEEPPAHAIFILATTEKHKIIPTILSRCQIFDFNRIRVEDGVSYLKYIAQNENITVDEESLHLIARKADGGMRDALSMFDKAVSFCGNSLHFKEVAQTLNVLDYDTYFSLTDSLLAGDYQSALLMFDEVLRGGFSGQILMSGLNGHFRDLLMCKDPKTIPLLEISGTLLDRYKTQADQCGISYLFDAIALLTALDGQMRTSSNQRLTVELGLMKLSGLGQKKNELTPTRVLECVADFTLPELKRGGASAASPQDSAPQTAETHPVMPHNGSQATVSQSHPASASSQPPPQTLPAEEEPSKPRSPQPVRRAVRSISGTSLSELMNTAASEEKAEESISETRVDPLAEAKIKQHAESFVNRLKMLRPRLAVVFEKMEVRSNTITLEVANESLYDEVMRNRTEVLTLLAEVAGVEGELTLSADVVASTEDLRPVRPEDKLKYLVERNPLIAVLKKELDMDLE